MKVFAKVWKGISPILFAGILAWLFCILFHPFKSPSPEPEFQGKKLTEWAREIDQGDFFRLPAYQQHQKKNEDAIAAIRHIGTNALPVVLTLCRSKDSWFKKKAEVWADQYDYDDWPNQRHFQIHIKSADEKRFEGVNIIWALGSMTKPIVPDLVQLLQSPDDEIAESMMDALSGAGTNAIPPLIKLLDSSDKNIRLRAAITLANFFRTKIPRGLRGGSPMLVTGSEDFRPQAHAAVPVLLQYLESPDRNTLMRIRVIYSLGLIKEDAAIVVPAIIRHIQSDANAPMNRLIIRNYIQALGNFGTNAKPAVPILVHILNSNPDRPDFSPRDDTLINLWKINPEAAKPFIEKWKGWTTNLLNPPLKHLERSPTVPTNLPSH